MAKYEIELEVTGKYIDGSPLAEIIKATQFYFPDETTVLSSTQAKQTEPASSTTEQPELADAKQESENETETEPESSSNLWLYIALGVGNLVVVLLGYFAYRLLAGKGSKDELAEIEKTLSNLLVALNPVSDSKDRERFTQQI